MTRAAIVIGIVAVLIGAFLAADLALDLLVEEAVETVGPVITGTSVELEDVDLSILDGRGSLQGLGIGSGPEGASVARVSAKDMRRITPRVSLAVTERMLTLGLGGRGESEKSKRGRKANGNDEAKSAEPTPEDDGQRRHKRRRR